MKIRFLLISLVAIISSYSLSAQVAVDNTLTVQELVENYLIGEGIEVDNITINGQPAGTVNTQAGVYTGPSGVVSFDSGVVMTTGNAVDVVTGEFGGGMTNPITGDPDLEAISGQNINDAIIIEFDFYSTSDSIKFNYVFASNEYPGYTCDVFNDAFGFFLSGPGYDDGPYENGAYNIALIPGTDIPVAINTVNSGVSSSPGNEPTCEAANPNWIEDSQYFVDNGSVPADDVQFPGMTQTLTALADVDCGQWYHIKLAIGDAFDSSLDSGVFLEAGSFAAAGEVFLNVAPTIGGNAVSNPDYDSVLVAGCSEAYIELIRPGGLEVDSVFVDFGGTAIEQVGIDPILGADYQLGENDTLFFFPEGVDVIGFTITTIWDQIPDENEFIIITVSYRDGCDSLKFASDTIPIVDPYTLDSSTEGALLTCPADSVIVSALGLDGIEPYIYDWGDFGVSGSENVLVPVPGDSAYYFVDITDACDFEIKQDSVLVVNQIPDPLQASINDFLDPECSNGSVDLGASIQDGNGDYTIIWVDGAENGYPQDTEITVGGINQTIIFNPDPINFIDSLPVYLTVIDTCGTTVRDSIFINYPFIEPLTVNFNPLTDNCPKEPLLLTSTLENGAGDWGFTWSASNGSFGEGADPTSPNIHVVPAGGMNVYTLAVSDYCNRLGFDYRYIKNENELAFSGFATHQDSLPVIKLDHLMNVITPNGDNKNDFFAIEGVELFDDSRLEVYDRWGKMIYESDNYRAGDPVVKPDNVFDADGYKDGTYFYVINVLSGECVASGTIEVLQGNN